MEQGKIRPLEGVAAFLERARQEISQHPTDTAEESDAVVTQTEMRREARAKERAETQKRMMDTYRPKEDTHAAGDPFKTLFVARLSYDTTERELAHEFERYGHIEDIHLVRDKHGHSRGYAFLLLIVSEICGRPIRVRKACTLADVVFSWMWSAGAPCRTGNRSDWAGAWEASRASRSKRWW